MVSKGFVNMIFLDNNSFLSFFFLIFFSYIFKLKFTRQNCSCYFYSYFGGDLNEVIKIKIVREFNFFRINEIIKNIEVLYKQILDDINTKIC